MPAISYAPNPNSSPSAARVYHGLQLLQSTAVVALLAPTSRVTVMLVILVVSMIAVSFPAASSSGLVAMPNLLFFMGKHFGTGVILATAFVHLLPDSFSSLLDKSVAKEYGNVGKWVGLIILGSLLAIFLVEYVSTTFVDYLHAEASAPSSPNAPSGVLPIIASPTLLQEPSVLLPFLANTPKIIRLRSSNLACVCQNGVCVCVPETPAPEVGEEDDTDHSHTHHDPDDHQHFHHGHGHDHAHHHHIERRRIGRRRQIVSILVLQVGIMIHSLVIGLTLSITSGTDFTSLTTAIIFHQIFEGLSLGIRIAALPRAKSHESYPEDEDTIEERHADSSAPSVSELEGVGSLVRPELRGIDSTDSPAPRLELHLNSNFESVAPTDAALPKSHDAASAKSSSRLRPPPLPLHEGSHIDWAGLGGLFTRSATKQPLKQQQHDHHHHHHHYGGTSNSHSPLFPSAMSSEERLLGERVREKGRGWVSFNPLKTTLSVLFAVTTPAGMGLGLLLWHGKADASDEASMKLTQGVMSAISAGMLIYAATVEMIAGDFVFGDLEGHHHHGGGDGHGHEHHHEHEHDHHGEDHDAHGEEHHHHHHGHHPSLGKRAVAVVSLLCGVAAMTLIGLGEPEGH